MPSLKEPAAARRVGKGADIQSCRRGIHWPELQSYNWAPLVKLR